MSASITQDIKDFSFHSIPSPCILIRSSTARRAVNLRGKLIEFISASGSLAKYFHKPMLPLYQYPCKGVVPNLNQSQKVH